MVEELYIQIIADIGYILNAFVIPIATAILGLKLRREKKSMGHYNPVRLIIFGIFCSFSVLVILEFMTIFYPTSLPLLTQIFGGFEGLSLYTFLIGIIASLRLTLVAFANRWEMLYFFPFFFYGGMLIFFILTSFDLLLMPYIYMAGALSIMFLYITGFRIKDNGALALAIFFTLAFGTVALDAIPFITCMAVILYDIFILIFVLGFFKPFKEEVLG
jgi:hypothetical protein